MIRRERAAFAHGFVRGGLLAYAGVGLGFVIYGVLLLVVR